MQGAVAAARSLSQRGILPPLMKDLESLIAQLARSTVIRRREARDQAESDEQLERLLARADRTSADKALSALRSYMSEMAARRLLRFVVPTRFLVNGDVVLR